MESKKIITSLSTLKTTFFEEIKSKEKEISFEIFNVTKKPSFFKLLKKDDYEISYCVDECRMYVTLKNNDIIQQLKENL